ncbi:cytochrome c biogenesis protein ResB [Cellulomonas marina]|uniref:Cytochrome c biogenesis protein n=1 Tax=Cellulomonas marina TaxID=988821 RepID=A0A1I0XIK8_9CELL|nr:cytochrome c biogenesis protein ResB [Cellulomonas marina]GIG30079.1 cytochrome c biogenesis protein ResB [Cellulomonas marina]SFB00842.1 cytochrome c biogenesis protein [Cellulomonas marina]
MAGRGTRTGPGAGVRTGSSTGSSAGSSTRAPYRPEGLDDAFVVPAGDDGPAAGATSAAGPGATGAGDGAGGSAGSGSSGGGPAASPDGPARPAPVALGVRGWLRWGWRQLTSMRVALLLLMLLAVAAVPGTVFPQNAQDPDRVATYLTDHPTAGPWLDRLGFFDVYSSVWFSAIYLLLMVSLVGCILPRTAVHLRGVRGRPPRTPRRFERFPARGRARTDEDARAVVERAAADLRRGWAWLPPVPRHRVDVHDEGAGTWSVSAERGYLRETGNLLFHLALVGLLVSVATGQLLHYRGQELVVQGRGFANAVTNYDTWQQGAAFRAESLVPFTLRLDDFRSSFDADTLQSRSFAADVTVTEPGGEPTERTIRVNHPLDVAGAKVYLQGNGYAPEVTVRDATGRVAFSGTVPFLPQDEVYTSRGVVKVPDVGPGQEQIGLNGFLLPTVERLGEGLVRSVDPQPRDPMLVLSVWTGDLGLDDGVPQNVYELDTTAMTQAVDAEGRPVTLYVQPGQTVDLPDGRGTVTFGALPRFVALDLRYDPALAPVLVFSLLAFAGLAVSLFAPRRRLWLRAGPADDDEPGRTLVLAAGLARGDDTALVGQVGALLRAALGPPPGGDAGPPRSPTPVGAGTVGAGATGAGTTGAGATGPEETGAGSATSSSATSSSTSTRTPGGQP